MPLLNYLVYVSLLTFFVHYYNPIEMSYPLQCSSWHLTRLCSHKGLVKFPESSLDRIDQDFTYSKKVVSLCKEKSKCQGILCILLSTRN